MSFALWEALKDLYKGNLLSLNRNPTKRLIWLIALSSLPTALIGLTFKESFERLFESVEGVAFFLALTGLLLWLSSLREGKKEILEITPWNALLIGVAQGCAIAPGVSRFGATLAAALLQGIRREIAARFTLLLSVPAILGAALVKLKDITIGEEKIDTFPFLLGSASALISGYFAISVLLRVVRRKRLDVFSYYCWAAALVLYLIL
jgi:undecaprenyl-diphosphatase